MPRPVAPRPVAPLTVKADAGPATPAPLDAPSALEVVTEQARAMVDRLTVAMGVTPSSPTTAPSGIIEGPFSALAKRGEFTGLLPLPSGKEVFVSVRLGKNPGVNRPVVMLDGVDGSYERNAKFETLVKSKDQSIITVALMGQGETLAASLAKDRTALDADIDPTKQAELVVEVLDTLGITEQVGLVGLSYGGAIAALAEKQFPDRFNKVMLISPFVESLGKQNPAYPLVNHAWNPLGQMTYRLLTRAMFSAMFPIVPTALQKTPSDYHDGIYRLTMGLETHRLKDSLQGMEDVHVLVAPLDPAANPAVSHEAYKGAKSASFTRAPVELTMQHDLVRASAGMVATWISDVMAGRVKAAAP